MMFNHKKMMQDLLDQLPHGAVKHLDMGGWLGGVLANPAKGLTVQNGYDASTNEGAQTDFSGAIGNGQTNTQNGINGAQVQVGGTNVAANTALNDSNAQAGQAGAISGLANSADGLGGVQGQQQGLANQLAAQAAGRGPNPAQQQFQQNVNAANAQQAGAVASTKGLNPALAARMAADNSAASTQGAASNEATLQAQQQLGAQAQLGQQQTNIANTVEGRAGLQNAAAGVLGGAGQTAGTAGGLYNAAGQTELGAAGAGNTEFATAAGGNATQNSNNINAQLGTSGLNQKTAGQNAASTEGTQSGIINSVGSALSKAMPSFAQGGEVGLSPMVQQILAAPQTPAAPPVDFGLSGSGSSAPKDPTSGAEENQPGTPTSGGLQSSGSATGDYLGGSTSTGDFLGGGASSGGGAGVGMLADAMAQGGSPGHYDGGGSIMSLAPLALALLGHGGQPKPSAHSAVSPAIDQQAMSMAQMLMARGGSVPGQDNVPGKNTLKNDVVPAVLSPKEIVLPLSVTESNDPGAMAKQFVEHLKAKAHPTYGHVLKARQALAKAEAAHKAQGGPC